LTSIIDNGSQLCCKSKNQKFKMTMARDRCLTKRVPSTGNLLKLSYVESELTLNNSYVFLNGCGIKEIFQN
jgi:hypothetical protein